MTESEERAACPFCGSNNISDGEILSSDADGGNKNTQSECLDCGAVGPRGPLEPNEIDYGSVKAIAAWNRRASSPPVPQQGAEAVAWRDKQGNIEWASDDLLFNFKGALYPAPPLEARLRDVKTNQEIDAMVREMKQPSDDAILDLAEKHLTLDFGDALVFARAVLALHAEPVEKMKQPSEDQIDAYLNEYSFEGDGGSYTPGDEERAVIKDAIMGLLAEPVEKMKGEGA